MIFTKTAILATERGSYGPHTCQLCGGVVFVSCMCSSPHLKVRIHSAHEKGKHSCGEMLAFFTPY